MPEGTSEKKHADVRTFDKDGRVVEVGYPVTYFAPTEVSIRYRLARAPRPQDRGRSPKNLDSG